MASPRTKFDDRDLAKARRVLDRIEDELESGDDLPHAYAQAVLEQAVRNANARPTPQAPMAASGLRVEGDTIRPAGGTPAEVAMGSEFGSDIYLQFQRPHNVRGYWLIPASESQEAVNAGDEALESILDRAVLSG